MLYSLLFASFLCFQKPNLIHYEKNIFTAYTLSQDETDADYFIGAGNHDLRGYVGSSTKACATRKFALHTTIFIKGIGECEILDRTSIKYANRIDILLPTKKEALEFGKKTLEYCIIK
jgi:3D (Asp-Asp-Asp) domain-containing protein